MKLPNNKSEAFIKSLKVNKYNSCGSLHKNEDRTYVKRKEFTTKQGERYGGYQIFILMYDWNKFSDRGGKDWGVQFEFHIVNDHNRCDLVVDSEKMTIKKFENICKRMYFVTQHDKDFKEVLK